jgi:hypothetical protein
MPPSPTPPSKKERNPVMTTYVSLEGYSFSDDRLHAPGHDELLLSDELSGPELSAEDGEAIYCFPPGTTEREILFYLAGEAAGEAAGARGTLSARSVEDDIYGRLLLLVRYAALHGIRIETLMHKALERCDPEPPFSG